MKQGLIFKSAIVALAMAAGRLPAQEAVAPALPAPAAKLSGSLFIYCAVGAKAGVDAVAKLFEAETGVKIEMTFANSGQLLGQIDLTRKGDLFIPGDVDFTAQAEDKKLTLGKARVFCYFVPGIFVRKGNPRGIKEITDLVKPGLKLALADKKAAIGLLQTQVFQKNNLDEEALKKNTVANPVTVLEAALAVKLGTADASIIWDALRDFAPADAELVTIPADRNVIGVVPAAVLASSKNVAAADAFLDYLVSDRGRALLKAKGYTVDDPAKK